MNLGRKTKENHHGQGQDIRQLFRKIEEKNKGKIELVVEKGKNKTNTDPVIITINQKDTLDVQKICNINVRRKMQISKNETFCGDLLMRI